MLFTLGACSKADETPLEISTTTPAKTRTPYATRTRSPVPSGLPTSTPTRTSRPTAATPSAIRASEEDLRGVRVVFWHAWTGELGEVMEEIIGEFNRTNRWGITVETHGLGGFGALEDAFTAARQEGKELPHLLSGYNYQALHWDVGGQVLADLAPYVNDRSLGFSAAEAGDFYTVFWEQDSAGVNTPAGRVDKRLGIPLHRSAQVLYYNRTWAEELGYDDVPDSPFDFRMQVCASAKVLGSAPGETLNGGWMITPEASTLLGWFYAYGGEIVDPQGNGYRFNSEETRWALDFLHSLVDDSCAWIGTGLEAAQAFAARSALIYAGSMAGLEVQEDAMRQADNNDKWTVIAFPSVNGEATIPTYGPTLILTKSAPEQELAAWLALKWLVSPENQAIWVRASSYYPTRASTLDFLDSALTSDEHWSAAIDLLPYVRAEPVYASWRVMRWSLSDAMVELFSPEFETEEIPALLVRLDAVAEEIHTQVR